MKTYSLVSAVCLSLLIGAAATISTASVIYSTPVPVTNCGYEWNTTTKQPTTVGCWVIRRGWPAHFLSGQMQAIFQDNMAEASPHSPMVSATSDAELQATPLVVDWFAWSAAAGLLLFAAMAARPHLFVKRRTTHTRRTK